MIKSKHLFWTFIFAFSLIACVFADSPVISKSSSFDIEVVFPANDPVFVLYAGNTPLSMTVVGRADAPIPNDPNNLPSYVLVSNTDLSSEDVKVYVRISQGNLAFKQISGITVTVSADELKLNGTGTEENEKTGKPQIGDISGDDSVDVDGDSTPDFVTVFTSSTSNSATFTVSYSGKPVPNIVNGKRIDVGSCSFTWETNGSLLAGTYYATISLSYSTE